MTFRRSSILRAQNASENPFCEILRAGSANEERAASRRSQPSLSQFTRIPVLLPAQIFYFDCVGSYQRYVPDPTASQDVSIVVTTCFDGEAPAVRRERKKRDKAGACRLKLRWFQHQRSNSSFSFSISSSISSILCQ